MITENEIEVTETSLDQLLNPTVLYTWMKMVGIEDESKTQRTL